MFNVHIDWKLLTRTLDHVKVHIKVNGEQVKLEKQMSIIIKPL